MNQVFILVIVLSIFCIQGEPLLCIIYYLYSGNKENYLMIVALFDWGNGYIMEHFLDLESEMCFIQNL
jgi:hypothetical protein